MTGVNTVNNLLADIWNWLDCQPCFVSFSRHFFDMCVYFSDRLLWINAKDDFKIVVVGYLPSKLKVIMGRSGQCRQEIMNCKFSLMIEQWCLEMMMISVRTCGCAYQNMSFACTYALEVSHLYCTGTNMNVWCGVNRHLRSGKWHRKAGQVFTEWLAAGKGLMC